MDISRHNHWNRVQFSFNSNITILRVKIICAYIELAESVRTYVKVILLANLAQEDLGETQYLVMF